MKSSVYMFFINFCIFPLLIAKKCIHGFLPDMSINVLQSFNMSEQKWFLQSAATPMLKKTSKTKKAVDITAFALWSASVAFCMYKIGMFRPKSPENVLRKAKALEERYEKLEKITLLNEKVDVNELLKGKNGLQKAWAKALYWTGEKTYNIKTKMGDELYNNTINTLGRTIILPMVILANPFGNNNSKNDKASVITREYCNAGIILALQAAFDKLFNVYMPKILKSNMFESEEIQKQFKQNGKVSIEQFSNIKYNSDETKRLFLKLTDVEQSKGGLKGALTKEQAKKLLNLGPFDGETFEGYWQNFNREIKNSGVVNLDLVKSKFKVVADSVGNFQLAKVKPKIAMNLVFVALVTRIFMGVVHGKVVQLLGINDEGGKK